MRDRDKEKMKTGEAPREEVKTALSPEEKTKRKETTANFRFRMREDEILNVKHKQYFNGDKKADVPVGSDGAPKHEPYSTLYRKGYLIKD